MYAIHTSINMMKFMTALSFLPLSNGYLGVADLTKEAAFIGYAPFVPQPTEQTIEYQNALMDAYCSAEHPGSMAANIAQLVERKITGLPIDNLSGFAAIPKCVDSACFGAKDASLIGGHARLCVLPDLPVVSSPATKLTVSTQVAVTNWYEPQEGPAFSEGLFISLPIIKDMNTPGGSQIEYMNTNETIPQVTVVVPPPVYGTKYMSGWPRSISEFYDNCYSNITRVAICVENVMVYPDEINMNPAESVCVGNCGKKVGYCHCDQTCHAYGDCCSGFSYEEMCIHTGEYTEQLGAHTQAVSVTTTTTASEEDIKSHMCYEHCDGKVGFCHCDKGCVTFGDCCPYFVYELVCGPKNMHAAVTATEGIQGGAKEQTVVPWDSFPAYVAEPIGFVSGLEGYSGACVGHCGKKAGYCWCDQGCAQNGDCCHGFSYNAHCAVKESGLASMFHEAFNSNGGNMGTVSSSISSSISSSSTSTNGSGSSGVGAYGVMMGEGGSVASLTAGTSLSCDGYCNSYTGSCWCDPMCMHSGDCCSDVALFCS